MDCPPTDFVPPCRMVSKAEHQEPGRPVCYHSFSYKRQHTLLGTSHCSCLEHCFSCCVSDVPDRLGRAVPYGYLLRLEPGHCLLNKSNDCFCILTAIDLRLRILACCVKHVHMLFPGEDVPRTSQKPVVCRNLVTSTFFSGFTFPSL